MPEIIRTRRYRADDGYDSFSDDDRRPIRTTEIRTARAGTYDRDGDGRPDGRYQEYRTERAGTYDRDGDGRPDGGYQTVQRYRIEREGGRSPSPVRSYRARSQDREVVRDVRVERTLEVDPPARPRSYVDYREIRDRDDDIRSYRGGDRDVREVVYERQVERDPEPIRERERQRTVVYERDSPRTSERDVRYWERPAERDWEREQVTDTQIVVARQRSPSPRYEREREKQVIIERRRERSPSPRYEMVTRETEYYAKPDPPPQPLVIRQQVPEPQRIYVEAAQPPAPIIVKQPQYEVVHRHVEVDNRREPEPKMEQVVYKRHEIRDSSSPEDDYLSERRYVRREGDWSDGEYEDDHRYRRHGPAEDRYRRRSRSRSVESNHHKRHLAEGAAAGAAAGAIIAHHRSKSQRGDGRGGKVGQVAGGAALGALGAQIATKVSERMERRKSRSRGRYEDDRGRRRRSESPGLGKKEKLGLGAALLGAALLGGKMMKDRNDAKKAEEGRGRSRTRSRSRISRGASPDHRHLDPRHRSRSIARNAALGAAALAIGQQVKKRRSKSKGGRSRSKSRIRTGAELAGAALATAAATGLYEKRKAKAEEKEELAGIPPSRSRSRGVSRSRSRSRARSVYSDYDRGRDVDVEYGDGPLVARDRAYVETSHTTTFVKEPLRLREKSRGGDVKADYWDDRRSRSRSRSRSKVRDAITGAAAAGAAAIGVKKYKDRKKRQDAEMDARGRSRSSVSSGDDHYYDRRDYRSDSYSPSPPRASGGAGYPAQAAPFPAPPVPGTPGTFHQTTTTTTAGPAPVDQYMSGGAGPGGGPALGGHNPNYYDDRTRGDNVSVPFSHGAEDRLDRDRTTSPPIAPIETTTHEARRESKRSKLAKAAAAASVAAAAPLAAAAIRRSRSLSPASSSSKSSPSPDRMLFNAAPLHPSLRNLAPPEPAESAATVHRRQRRVERRSRRPLSESPGPIYPVDDRGRPYEDRVEPDGTIHRHYHRRPHPRPRTPTTPSSSSESDDKVSLSPPRERRRRHLDPTHGAEYGSAPFRPHIGRRRATSLMPEVESGSRQRRRPISPSPDRARSQSAGPTNKSVTFAPLSPQSSMALALVKSRKGSPDTSPEREAQIDHDLETRRRRHSPSGSETGSDVEEVPRRFDERGRPIYDDEDSDYDRGRRREHRRRGRKRTSGGAVEGEKGSGGGDEVVEIIQKVVGVLEGKGDWKDLLKGVVEAASGGAVGGKEDGRKRRRH